MVDFSPTFGCGQYLPGRGPGNFPDYSFGGNIDVGEDDNNGGQPPDTPLLDEPPITPPPGDQTNTVFIPAYLIDRDVNTPGTVFYDGGQPYTFNGQAGNLGKFTFRLKGAFVSNATTINQLRINDINFAQAYAAIKIAGPAGAPTYFVEGLSVGLNLIGSRPTNPAQVFVGTYSSQSPTLAFFKPTVPAPLQSPNSGNNTTGTSVTTNRSNALTVFSVKDVINPNTGQTVIRSTNSNNRTGSGLLGAKLESSDFINQAANTGEVDLNDPNIAAAILADRPSGIQDDNAFWDTYPQKRTLVKNNTGYLSLFDEFIDSNVAYVLSNIKSTSWSPKKLSGISSESVYNSLNKKTKDLFSKIKNYDGSPLTKVQIFSMIGSRILDGTLDKFTPGFLEQLAQSSSNNDSVVYKKSTDDRVNELTAVRLIEKNMFPLDPTKTSERASKILPNWKSLSSDTDRHINIVVDGQPKKYYIKDDDTFINNSSYSLKDGEYFEINVSGTNRRYYTNSEKDHAFILSEDIKQKAISLLGGSLYRTLEVSSNNPSSIEFEYSLSAPRQNFYFLKAILSSIETSPHDSGSFLLKDTRLRYELMDSSSTSGIAAINEYIKYKVNHRVFILDDEDVMLDYIEQTSSMFLTQVDIVYDSPKTNKEVPILTRQIPWYIIVYPSNRPEYNLFNARSQITDIKNDGSIVRKLKCRTTITPEFNQSNLNKFAPITLVNYNSNCGCDNCSCNSEAVNVYGQVDPQARISKINVDSSEFKKGYRVNGIPIEAKATTPKRKKTGIRAIKEVITDLDNNYVLHRDGGGKSITEAEVFSNLRMSEYNKFAKLENPKLIKNALRKGLVGGVKVIPTINRADSRVTLYSTSVDTGKSFIANVTVTQVPVRPPIDEGSRPGGGGFGESPL